MSQNLSSAAVVIGALKTDSVQETLIYTLSLQKKPGKQNTGPQNLQFDMLTTAPQSLVFPKKYFASSLANIFLGGGLTLIFSYYRFQSAENREF